MRVPVTQNLHQDNVHEQADAGHDEHELPVNVLLRVGFQTLDESVHSSIQQHARQHPDQQHTDNSTDHFSSLETEAHFVGSWQRGHPDREQRDAEAGHIREQVGGVRHDGQTASDGSPDDLSKHEEHRAQAGQLQFPLGTSGTLGQRDAAWRVDQSIVAWRALLRARAEEPANAATGSRSLGLVVRCRRHFAK